jgi:hypothetical protein
MLREELEESDIPGRTTIRNCVDELFQEHINRLKRDMKVS